MRRSVCSGSVLAVLILVGCSSSPDLMQCQTVAELDSQLESFFEQRNAGEGSAEALNAHLDEIADAYAEVDVTGDLKSAVSALSHDLRALHDHRVDDAQGDMPVASEEEELIHAAAVSLTEVQTVCTPSQFPG